MPLHAMERENLADRVTLQLESLIESGEWPIGSKIPAEPVLVQMLEVGRNTVREAVRALIHNGMLEARQGDGTYVRASDNLGPAVLRRLRRAGHLEALEVRNALERDAARLAAERRTPTDVATLRASLRQRDETWQAGDHEAFVQADVAFHRQVVATAHNGMLSDLYSHLLEGLHAAVDTLARSPLPEELRSQRNAHVALVDAIEAGDADAAQQCVEHYIGEAVMSVKALQDADTPHEG